MIDLDLELKQDGDRSGRLVIGEEPVACTVEVLEPSSAAGPLVLEFDAEQRLVGITFGDPAAQLPADLAPAIKLDRTLCAASIYVGRQAQRVVWSSRSVLRPAVTYERTNDDLLRLSFMRDGQLYRIESLLPRQQFALSTLARLGVAPLSAIPGTSREELERLWAPYRVELERDVVSLSELLRHVIGELPGDAPFEEARAVTLAILRGVAERGEAEFGLYRRRSAAVHDWAPWSGARDELMAKVEADWREYGFDRIPLPGEIVYLRRPR